MRKEDGVVNTHVVGHVMPHVQLYGGDIDLNHVVNQIDIPAKVGRISIRVEDDSHIAVADAVEESDANVGPYLAASVVAVAPRLAGHDELP